MTYIPYNIPVPDIIAHIGVAILLFYRKICFGVAFRKIKLTQGKYAMVSPEDFEEINSHKWRVINNHNDTFYAIRRRYDNGRRKHVIMHREIMHPQDGFVVDHEDGNGLNNTRDNLRIVTAAQNSYNRRKYIKKCSSKYKGVSRRRRDNRWIAIIMYRGISINLGFFDDEIDAAKAYDDAAKELYGQYAKLNFG
jgi:hypothetical protein